MYKREPPFGTVPDPFLSQVFSLVVIILTGSPGFKGSSRFCFFGSITVSEIESCDWGDCGLTADKLMQNGQLNNLWGGYNPFLLSWEAKNSIEK